MSIFFEKLVNVCHELLYHDKKIFDYYKNRNISSATIKKYKLGTFPKDLRVLNPLISEDELIENKIIWNSSESMFKCGPSTDIIYHYPILIPIRNFQGEAIAIGCRTLADDDRRKKLGIPKYKNSIYSKTSHLFGLDRAVKEIRNKDKVFVVEGYFDVISCHQVGIFNVVAPCGTLFSKKQLIKLLRYTDNICLLFDNDEAGHISAKQIVEKFTKDSMINANLTYRFTPDGFKDIDEYINKNENYLNFF